MKKVLLLLFSLWGICLHAQVKIEAWVDQTAIGIDDVLRLTVELSGPGADRVNYRLPEIYGFDVVGSSSSSSSSVTIINGKMESNTVLDYTFTLEPKQTGSLVIPPLSYKGVNGATKPITVTVTEGSLKKQQQQQSRQAPPSSDFSPDKANENLFIRAEVDKRTVVKGEPITINYRLYTRYQIFNMSFGEEPVFKGFWKNDVYVAKQVNFQRTTVSGIAYNTMLLRTVTLVPTDTGKLTVPSLPMHVDVQTQSRSFFDFGTQKSINIASDPIAITVNELPKNAPPSFNGAVGKFTMSAQAGSQKAKVGDSVTLTLIIKGEGNLEQFDAPSLGEIPHFRVMDPEVDNEMNQAVSSTYGVKTVKYLLIPQEEGKYEIPEFAFSYYSPGSKQYQTQKAGPFPMEVTGGGGSAFSSGNAQSIVKSEGADIGFIHTEPAIGVYKPYLESIWYWLLAILIVLTLPAGHFYAEDRAKMQSNASYMRDRLAGKILKRYMKQATLHAKNADGNFYAAAQTGLLHYLADKLKQPQGIESKEIINALSLYEVDEQIIDKIKDYLQLCDEARFMPGGFSAQNISKDYEKLSELLSILTKINFLRGKK